MLTTTSVECSRCRKMADVWVQPPEDQKYVCIVCKQDEYIYSFGSGVRSSGRLGVPLQKHVWCKRAAERMAKELSVELECDDKLGVREVGHDRQPVTWPIMYNRLYQRRRVRQRGPMG